MRFSNMHRREVMDANPGVKVTEVAKILGQMWRGMSQDEKDGYKEEVVVSDCSDTSEEGYCGC